MQIFPNSSKNLVTFRNIPENTVIILYNFDGKIVKKLSSVYNDYNLDISFLKRGLYMIKTYSKEHFLTELLVKE